MADQAPNDQTADPLPEVSVPAAPKPAQAPAAPVAAAPQASDLVAVISSNGQLFTGWDSFTIKRSFGTGISVFSFTPAEGSFGQGYARLTIQPGDPVTITLAGQQAFKGWCKARSGAYDAQSHQLVITGESLTVDLSRSSIPLKPGTYDNSTFEQVARSVLSPHGINLRIVNPASIASKPIASLTVQPGESPAGLLARIAPMRGFFLTDDANGNLVASQGDPGAGPVAQLYEGRNIKAASWKLEDPSAAAFYKMTGNTQQPGSDQNWPPRDISATANASGVRPNTFHLFVAEHPGDAQDLAQMVNHKASTSLWPETNVSVTVVGWIAPDGQLWAPEAPRQNVTLYSPMVFGDTGVRTLGIQSVTYAQDPNGSTTVLELVRPDAQTTAPTSSLSRSGASVSPAQPDAPDTSSGT